MRTVFLMSPGKTRSKAALRPEHHVMGSGSDRDSCAVLLVRETAAHPFLALALRSGCMPCLAHLQKLDISGASPADQHCLACQGVILPHGVWGAIGFPTLTADEADAAAGQVEHLSTESIAMRCLRVQSLSRSLVGRGWPRRAAMSGFRDMYTGSITMCCLRTQSLLLSLKMD